jgi:hypothetical protein
MGRIQTICGEQHRLLQFACAGQNQAGSSLKRSPGWQ